MASGQIALVLLYEPGTGSAKPVPLARVVSEPLAVEAAKAALDEAQRRADELSKHDEVLGDVEQAEVDRLRAVLSLLIPGLKSCGTAPGLVQ